jgi:hypothetical protein
MSHKFSSEFFSFAKDYLASGARDRGIPIFNPGANIWVIT